MPPIVPEAKKEPGGAPSSATATTTALAAAIEPEDQLGQIVKDLNEFISAKMHHVKEAMVGADLIETTKVTSNSKEFAFILDQFYCVIQVHPATMLGWYDHDRKKNNGMTVHLPLVLKAYFKCIEIKVCFFL